MSTIELVTVWAALAVQALMVGVGIKLILTEGPTGPMLIMTSSMTLVGMELASLLLEG